MNKSRYEEEVDSAVRMLKQGVAYNQKVLCFDAVYELALTMPQLSFEERTQLAQTCLDAGESDDRLFTSSIVSNQKTIDSLDEALKEQRKTIAKYRKKIDKLEADLKEANFKLYLIQQGLTTTYLDAAEKEDE